MKKSIFLVVSLLFTVAVVVLALPVRAQQGQPSDSAYMAQLAAILDGLRAELAALSAQVNSAAAVDAASTPPSTPTPVPFGPVPAQPSNLLAIASPGGPSVYLYWQDNSSNESGFYVERSRDGFSFSTVGTTTANSTFYTDFNVARGARYWYRVRAFNAFGSSAPSNVVVVLVPDPPASPSDLAANAVSPTQINLSWRDNAWNENGFLIDRQEENGPWFVWRNIPVPNATFFSDMGLTPFTTYRYQVRSYNYYGTSSPSNTASSTTPGGAGSELLPRNLMTTPLSLYRVLLNWEDRSIVETGFRIERDTVLSSGGFRTVATTAANTNAYEHLFFLDASTTRAATDYVYRVWAFNTASSAVSNLSYVRTQP